MMKTIKLLTSCAVLFSSPLQADNADDTPINNTRELRAWCKHQSERHFLAQDLTPYNWTASYWTEGNILKVQGQWKVKNKQTTVHCSVRNGATEKNAGLRIEN